MSSQTLLLLFGNGGEIEVFVPKSASQAPVRGSAGRAEQRAAMIGVLFVLESCLRDLNEPQGAAQ